MDINSEIGGVYFYYPHVTRSDFTFRARTRLRWSDNLCSHRDIVTTIVAMPHGFMAAYFD